MKSSTVTGSVERVYRTIIQLLVAAPVIVGATVALHLMTTVQAAKVTGIAAGVIAVVTGLHNALESAGVLPAILRYIPSSSTGTTPSPAPADPAVHSVP